MYPRFVTREASNSEMSIGTDKKGKGPFSLAKEPEKEKTSKTVNYETIVTLLEAEIIDKNCGLILTHSTDAKYGARLAPLLDCNMCLNSHPPHNPYPLPRGGTVR